MSYFPNRLCCIKPASSLSNYCIHAGHHLYQRLKQLYSRCSPSGLQVSVLFRQSVASVQGLGHVAHSDLHPVLLRLRPPTQPHEEGRAELCQHLRVLQQVGGVPSQALLPERRQALCALHRALPLLQEVSSVRRVIR